MVEFIMYNNLLTWTTPALLMYCYVAYRVYKRIKEKQNGDN
jgi:hypothetical protein